MLKQSSPVKIEYGRVPNGQIYGIDIVTRSVIVNTEHPFGKDIQESPEHIRSGIEVLLLTIGEGEMNAVGDKHLYYQSMRHKVSERLREALNKLQVAEKV